MRRSSWSTLALICAALCASTSARATDYHFNNINGGSWSVSTNWTPNGVPSLATDRAFLDAINNYTVTLSTGTTITVGSITIGSSTPGVTPILELSNHTQLKLATGTSTVMSNGLLQLAGGNLLGPGTLAISGTLRPISGPDTVACPVTTVAGSTIRLHAIGTALSVVFTGASQTRINGTLMLSSALQAADTLTMAGSDTLYLMPGSSFLTTPTLTSQRVIRGAVVNAGGIATLSTNTQLSSNGTAGSFTNLGNGTVSVAAGTLTTDSLAAYTFTNQGTIALSGGDLYLPSGGLTEYGPITIAAGRRLRSKGGFLSVTGSNMSGPGRLEIVNANVFVNLPGWSSNGLHVDIDGGGFSSLAFGSFTVAVGDTLVSNNMVVGSPVLNRGLWIARGTTDATTGGLTTFAGSRLRIEAAGAAAQLSAFALTNNGVIEMTSSGNALLASAKTATLSVFKLTNMPGDSVLALQGVGGERYLTCRVDNRGVIQSQTGFDSGTWRLRIGNPGAGSSTNSGSVEATLGNINWTLGATDTLYETGSIATTGPAILRMSGGHIRFQSGAAVTRLGPAGPYANYTGQFAADSTDWILDADFSPDTLGVTLTRTSVHGPGALLAKPWVSYTADGTTFGSALFSVPTFIVRDTVNMNSVFTAAPRAYLYVVGGSGGHRARWTTLGGVTNYGHLFLDGFGADASVLTQSGPFSLSATDTLEARYTNGSAILSPLDNKGYITIDAGSTLLIEKGASSHSNSGRIDVHGVFNVSNSAAPPPGMDFTNSGSIRVFGATVNVNNAGTFTNAATGTISGTGTLNISPGTTFVNLGTISPGFSPGALSINGAVTMGSNAVTKVEIAGSASGTQYDHLAFSGGPLNLSGTLQLSMYGCGFFPQPGDTFRVIDAPSVAGTFTNVTGANIGGGLSFQVLYRTDGVTLLTVGTYTNQRPHAAGDVQSMALVPQTTLTPLANDSDPDGNALSILAVLHSRYGVAVIDSGATTLTYVRGENFTGVDTVTYVVTDCLGGRDTANVVVWVGGAAGVGDGAPALAHAVRLSPPVPNPFVRSCSLFYELPAAGHVTLTIYDVSGRVVRTLASGAQSAGVHTAHWDGRDALARPAPAGVYFALLRAGGSGGETRLARLVLSH